jgi:hypothetical protein
MEKYSNIYDIVIREYINQTNLILYKLMYYCIHGHLNVLGLSQS